MPWVLVWFGLLVAAGLEFGLLGRTLWRKAKALTRELGAASEKLTGAFAALNDLAEPAPDEQPSARTRPTGARDGRRYRRGRPR